MNMLQKILLTGALAALLVTAGPAAGQAERRNEEFRYRWQLKNFVGTLAGLFLPNQGEGSLTFTRNNGHLTSELLITSDESRRGEYFRYGSEIDTATLQPIRAWSSYQWRGETRSKSDDIDREGVLDVASGIYSIRRDPPTKPRRMEIWSEGKIYPVVVIPLGLEQRKLPGGKKVAAHHYSIRGVNLPDRRRWKGRLDLWLAANEAATPVEIVISRNMADVRLELVSAPDSRARGPEPAIYDEEEESAMSRCKIVWMLPLAVLLLALPACRREQTESPDTVLETTAVEGTVPPLEATPAGPSARATLQGAPEDTDFSGTVTFTQQGDGLLVVADFAGVDTPGEHGFHVHENGDCSHDPGGQHFTAAGGHFDPAGAGVHACPPAEPRHAGDLGNVQIGADGSGRSEQTTNLLSLSGPNSVVGKAIILHSGADDCQTQPTGNSGGRIACGVVTMEGSPAQ